MSLVQTNQQWQFSSELALEDIVWRNLPELLNVEPLRRQFSIDGKVCDILAVDSAGHLVIIELKNTEDRYIAQQLTRYYDAIANENELPFSADTAHPRLVGISPSYHHDTFTDCRYSTLDIELLHFRLTASATEDITFSLYDVSDREVSTLRLPSVHNPDQPDRALPEPPRKLLNWLSHSTPAERDWVMQMRAQLLNFDPRMKEIVTATSIFYGRGKTKACCELRKERPAESKRLAKAIASFLWLPHPEYRTHVIRMMVNFNLEQQQIRQLLYSKASYQTKEMWIFPDRPNKMGVLHGMPRFKEHYLPLLNVNNSISAADIVALALRTWHKRA